MPPVFGLFAILGFFVSFVFCTPTPRANARKPLTSTELQARQPLNGLPPPSNGDYTLVYSALGIGHQNYTCSNNVYVQSQPGDGASALLYDTTSFLESHPTYIKRLSQNCNYWKCKFPQLKDNLLGDHYFSELIQPTFNLTQATPQLVLSGVKSGDVAAPNATKNIDWLFLTANPNNYITQGLRAVYRINTFRGRAPTSCSVAGQTTSIPYTAQYWFYD